MSSAKSSQDYETRSAKSRLAIALSSVSRPGSGIREAGRYSIWTSGVCPEGARHPERPVRKEDLSRAAETKGTAAVAQKQIDILVVDDEEMMRELLEDVLQLEGYSVETAEDGQAAMVRVKESAPLLVICDIKMPRMNGFELLKSVKERFPETRVIMMTGYSDDFTVKDL